MCGITGALTFGNSPFRVTERYIRRMRDTMVHRGPDGCGAWISECGRVGLGHRRLSILDLSDAAAQPMCNEDRSLWISFNGEIYNHGEIRRELESIGGHRWKTDHSDTEVILHAFEEWGIDCLDRFRGMFAIALWDARARALWLIRDRIGIKPLYYSIHNGRITFASEIKALLTDPDQKRAVDEEALYDYLSFMTTPAPKTLFAGIHKLAAGNWLRVSEDGQLRRQHYWDVLDHTIPLDGADENEIADRLLTVLRESVALRKVSDVPLGVFLSGGVDSSTNVALFSEGEHAPVKTFSIGYDRSYASYENELEFARMMAENVGAEHHERCLNIDDLLDFLPEMIRLQDEPIGDPVCVPVYYVSKHARDHGVTVCQIGEGADELFCGYPGWLTIPRLERLNNLPVPRFLRRAGLGILRMLGKQGTGYYELLRRGTMGQPLFWGGAEAFTEAQKNTILSARMREQFAGRTSWDALAATYERFRARATAPTPINWMRYLDLNQRLPELLLARVDKMSMGVSLEARVPFLDHKFVELAMSVPDDLLVRNREPKYILKQAVRGLIPDELIWRRKQGFGVPVHEWFFDRLGERARQELHAFCEQTDFLDHAAVLRLLDEGCGQKAWYLLNLALWWKEYFTDDRLPKDDGDYDASGGKHDCVESVAVGAE